MSEGRKLIGQILKQNGKVREGQIQEALSEQRKHGGLIGQHLVSLGHCSDADVASGLAEQAGLTAVDLNRVQPTEEALGLVDAATAHAYSVLPIALENGKLKIALSDPLNTAVLEDLAFTTGVEIEGAIADERGILERIKDCLLYTSPSPRDS